MIDTTVCAAPAGFDGSGRVRVPSWASPVTSAASITGGAMPTGTPGSEREAALAPRDTQPVGTATPFATSTDPYSTLGNHSPGRPRS